MNIYDDHNHFCIYCGAKLEPNQKFCTQCGKQVFRVQKIKKVVPSKYDEIINDIEKRLSNINIHIKLTDNARNHLIKDSYDINFGARPLKRKVSRAIETMLAKMIITNEIGENENILIDYQGDSFIVRK